MGCLLVCVWVIYLLFGGFVAGDLVGACGSLVLLLFGLLVTW